MKRVLALCCIILAILPFSSAVDIDLRQNYQPGETLIIKIEGNFIEPLTIENIRFYAGRIQIPLTSEIAKIDESYYLYALLQNQVRNYTLMIENAHYIENSQEMRQDLAFNFSVLGNITDFSIEPGYVIANKDFSIEIESKNKALTVAAKTPNNTKSIIVPLGQKRQLYFSAAEFTANFSYLELSSPNTRYRVPVKIITPSTPPKVTQNFSSMNFLQKEVNFTALKNSKVPFSLVLKNTGNTTLQQIRFNVSKEFIIDPAVIDELAPSQTRTLNITASVQSRPLFSFIIAQTNQTLAQIPVFIEVTDNKSQVILPPSPTPYLESCTLLGGKICAPAESCSGDVIDSLEGKCCRGTCAVKKNESKLGTYIAVAVILLIIGALIFFSYKKSKTQKKQFSDVMKEKSQKVESKFHPPTLPETQVRGQLTNI